MMDLSKSYEYFQPEKSKAKIHIIGCGSVGSTVAENLARSGVTNFVLWDFDKVEPHNLANQMFRQEDVGKLKVEAVSEMLQEINPDIKDTIKLEPEGWQGKQLSGFVFLCVDNIDLRREIVEKHFDNPNVKAMFDFRTRLEDAQHYAADWSDIKMKKIFLDSMNFSHEEAKEETPVSACNVTLSVCPTVRIICAYGVANFMNFWNGKPLKKLVLVDAFNFAVDAF
ncbi:MAG: ThiF family adenylyltransferase [Oscillospiraceae bacterium]|nr:ThiF family adenylyltransferase [Candidatus Limimonas egerieequi]